MNYLAVFVLVMMSMGRVVYPVCTECPQEIGKMIQQMLDDKQYNNHKASGRDYYLLKNDLVPEDPGIRFGDEMLQLTEADTGTVFEARIKYNVDKAQAELSLFLENDNLEALGTFECPSGSWKLVNIRFLMF